MFWNVPLYDVLVWLNTASTEDQRLLLHRYPFSPAHRFPHVVGKCRSTQKPNDKLYLFFCYQHLFYFFSHITQHSIQNITKQNNRHILNISKSSQKGGREGGTTKTQKSLLHTITKINTAKHMINFIFNEVPRLFITWSLLFCLILQIV